MQLQMHAWESALLNRAYEARCHELSLSASSFAPTLCARAYAHCEAITAANSKSFYLASALLPGPKRRAVRALYAFCRVTDDLVDLPGASQTRLDDWRARVLTSTPPEYDLVAVAWTDARLRYGIPLRYAEQLIDGVAQDLQPRRYATFDELAAYSYGVASTVALMSMHIIGYTSTHAIRYAIKLGVALQLTNILRDVAEDWRAGRVYLPVEDLSRYALGEADIEHGIASGVVTPQWREFMRFQIERNRRLYAEAILGIAYLSSEGRFAVTAAADLYCAILGEIERNGYNVFSRRIGVSAWGRVQRLPVAWWRARVRAISPQRPRCR